MNEKLSALLDGELEVNELEPIIKKVAHESTLLETWGRYHLIRDAMRGQLAILASTNIAANVSAQLQLEPSILAPRRRSAIRVQTTRWIAGMAVAASVAAVAIVGVRWFAPDQHSDSQLIAQSVESVDYLRSSGNRWQSVSTDVERDLNMYLVQHNEFTPATGMNGVMTYMRFVGYDAEK